MVKQSNHGHMGPTDRSVANQRIDQLKRRRRQSRNTPKVRHDGGGQSMIGNVSESVLGYF
jgi:hypothetical protein